MTKQRARADWQTYPFSIEIAHDGNLWIITFRAKDDDPKYEYDVQVVGVAGWLSPAKIQKHLENLPPKMKDCCTNFAEATNLDNLERIFNESCSAKIVEKLSGAVELVQGRTVCWN